MQCHNRQWMNLISSSQCCCILTGAMLLNQSSCFFQATSGRYFQVTISSTCCNVRWEYYGDWYIVSSVACFSMYPTTGSFKRIEVFKIRMRAIKMDQINIWSSILLKDHVDILQWLWPRLWCLWDLVKCTWVWVQITLNIAGAEYLVKFVLYHFSVLVNTCLQLLVLLYSTWVEDTVDNGHIVTL